MATVIKSEDSIPIEESFKVSAGPGAGKTYWLTRHIRQVLAHSTRLGTVKKVACITYTNVGTETIYNRLGCGNKCVEVATIHSFLYANVVKPYAYLVAGEIGLKCDDLRVVDDSNYMSKTLAKLILKAMGKTWIDADRYYDGLCMSRWKYKNHAYVGFMPKYPVSFDGNNGKKYFIANDTYMFFKKYLWEQGLLTYDDILYVSWLLFAKTPNIYTLLRAKYPYFFVDEFQDTIPFVVDFLQEIGKNGTVIGVVGDKAQAIYEFVDATAKQFDRFTISGMKLYEIHGNRRSSLQIVNLLNAIRTSFKQDHLSGIVDAMPMLMVGDMLEFYHRAVEECSSKEVRSLAFPNIIANSMRTERGLKTAPKILEQDFDSDPTRQYVIKALIKAVEYARLNDLREAWHQLDIINNDRNKTIVILRKMLENYDKYSGGTLFDFHQFVTVDLGMKLKSFKAGKSMIYYQTHSYADAALSVRVADVDTKHKTIHKAKGEEFDFVYVVLKEEADLEFMLNPDLDGNNAHRVYYVGISRAKRRLFVNVPSLSQENEKKMKGLPIAIFRHTSL